MWEKEAGRELNALARESCATVCPFRVDCYMTSYQTGDAGVIRGGIMLAGRIKVLPCERCGVPSVRPSKKRVRRLCSVCICSWDCHGCGKKIWLERTTEPKTFRQYHSQQCQLDSLARRLWAAQIRRRMELAA